ncbi:hypothetical protein AK812_SmicGene17459 [Symbiodinium microadriaticum]|uniref:Uncharacterized protein n=1 Tax=Symbiodinium microadriaticum TaxID=2951 RepID=A0A1Q9DXP5_SYMMI|nr:hypothetical protein AK812_SmicGene17459 [Symbiodinium microadriaticum]
MSGYGVDVSGLLASQQAGDLSAALAVTGECEHTSLFRPHVPVLPIAANVGSEQAAAAEAISGLQKYAAAAESRMEEVVVVPAAQLAIEAYLDPGCKQRYNQPRHVPAYHLESYSAQSPYPIQLNDAAGRQVTHDGGMQEQLRQLELLRHRELQHLRLQEEQLESLQYGEYWEEPVIVGTSDPPARLVDPGLMEGSPPQRSYGPGRRSDLRQVMAPSSLVAHWPRDLEVPAEWTPQIKDLDPSGDESPPLPARSRR